MSSLLQEGQDDMSQRSIISFEDISRGPYTNIQALVRLRVHGHAWRAHFYLTMKQNHVWKIS